MLWTFQSLSKNVYFAITSKPNVYNLDIYKFIKTETVAKKGVMAG